MKKENKIKIFFGLIYLLVIIGFLWVFFSKFTVAEITSYEFIKNNKYFFSELKDKNFFILTISFFLFTIFWVLLLGFGMPILLISGFIFGKFIGTLFATLGLTIGATLLYIFANFFVKDLIQEKFYKRFSNLNDKFKKNEFTFFLIYRLVGGIPFFISNILPTIFNVKTKNFFFGTLLGILPQVFIVTSLGSGLGEIIENNLKVPSLTEIVFSPKIYFPIFGFIFLIILAFILKSIFYKK